MELLRAANKVSGGRAMAGERRRVSDSKYTRYIFFDA